MSTAIALATEADTGRVLSLMQRYHEEAGLPHDDAHRLAAVAPILGGNPLAAIWLIGPARAPLGYVFVSFGWSVAHGGMVGWLEEAFIRPSVRSRGIGTEIVHIVALSLSKAGMKAMHARLPDSAERASGFCKRCGFSAVSGEIHLSERL